MLLAWSLAALAAALSCGGDGDRQLDRTTVHIGSAAIDAELALTQGQRSLGLGGRDELERDAGMLFVLPTEGNETFWMKRMGFPLDFIWISEDRRILGVTENVPRPAAGTADTALPLYKPPAPIRYALEVNGGLVRELGLNVGDAVTFEPEVDTARAR